MMHITRVARLMADRSVLCVAAITVVVCSVAQPAAADEPGPGHDGAAIPPAIATKLQKLFGGWLREWQRVDATVTLNRFRLVGGSEWTFTPTQEFDATSTWFTETSDIRIHSPDSALAINPWMRCVISDEDGPRTCTGCEPDVSAALFDRRSQRWGEIAGCGTPCLYDDAGWISNRVVVLAEQTEYYPQDGPLYPDTVVIVPYFQIFDLAESTRTVYQGPPVPAARVVDAPVRSYSFRRMNELLAR